MLYLCPKCQLEKPEDAFAKRKDGKKVICRECNSKQCKEWRAKHPSYWRDMIGSKGSTARYKYYDKRKRMFVRTPYHYLKHLWQCINRGQYASANTSRRRKQLAVEITVDGLCKLWDKQQGRCALTKLPMLHEHRNLRSVSIDRIESDRAYVAGNIQLVCRFVNFAKSKYSNEEFLAIMDDCYKLREVMESTT